MFEHLLVAIDETPSCPVTLSFVTALARQEQASVHLVFVNELVAGGRGRAHSTDAEALRLVELAALELRAAGIPTTGSVVRANPFFLAQAVAACAERRGADAVVLGSRRRRFLGRLSGHAVRERIIGATHLPVLVAPAPLAEPRRRRARGELVPDRLTAGTGSGADGLEESSDSRDLAP
ncbi:MAG TPA: universal stress protein [Acidimicrobiales bacterium]|nr:universal stress protein [Acidimicrobiales bacterium]